ncbi:MAG: hypothetical protein KatS3mg087_1850 [Patescibacteria group bacterium]|nr:MAG: hypothetical protein KatS3mg087_1850 [Patescibacteria group bacterium]
MREFIQRAVVDFQMHPKSAFVIAKASLNRCLDYSYPLVGDYCGFPYARSIEPLVVEDLDKAHRNFCPKIKNCTQSPANRSR